MLICWVATVSFVVQGSMKPVVDCLLTLRAKSLQNALGDTNSNSASPRGNSPISFHSSPPFGDQRKVSSESRFQRVLSSPVMTGPVNFNQLILSLLYVCPCVHMDYGDNEIQFPKRGDMLRRKLIYSFCNLNSLSNVV